MSNFGLIDWVRNFLKRSRDVQWLLCLLPLCASAPAQVVTATIPLPTGNSAFAIAVNPLTNKIYALTDFTVEVIDGSTSTVTVVPFPDGYELLSSICINSKTNKIYFSGGTDTAGIVVMDGSTNALTTVVDSDGPGEIAIDETTNKAYVANLFRPTVSVLDGATNTITATIATSTIPQAVAVDPILHKAYAVLADVQGSSAQENLIAIDGKTNAVTYIATAGEAAQDVLVNPSTHQVFVLDANTNNKYENFVPGVIAIVDGKKDKLITTRPIGSAPYYAAINPTKNFVYIVNTYDTTIAVNGNNLVASLSVLNGNDLSVLSPHNVRLGEFGGVPENIAVNTVTSKVFVSQVLGGQYLTVVDGRTFLPAAIPVSTSDPFTPVPTAVDPLRNRLYTIQSGNLVILDGTGGSTGLPSMFPETLGFEVKPGTSSPAQTLYLANNGGAPMEITNLEFNSGFARALRQTNDCPNPLPALAVCPISITYTPKRGSAAIQTGPFYAVAAPAQVVTSNIYATVVPVALKFTLFMTEDEPGATKTQLNGTLTVDSPDPTLTVAGNVPFTVTLDGVTVQGTAVNGSFSVNVTTPPLTLSSYPVTFASQATGPYLASTGTGAVSVVLH